MEIVESDVLVIGGGGAGCRAAIAANEAKASVTIAVKGGFGRIAGLRGAGATGNGGPFGFASTPSRGREEMGGAGIAQTPEEEREALFEYGLKVGLGMADRQLTKILVDEAFEAKRRLKEWGLLSRDIPGFIACDVAPMPGLANVIRATARINILEHVMVTGLIIQNGRCVGAVGLDENSGDTILLRAKSTILATGGSGQLFMHNFHPSCVTGDGYAISYEAGAELLNMEFQQMIWAIVYPTYNILIGIWDAHPKVLNVNHQEFMQNYLPQGVTLNEVMDKKSEHWPFSGRDISKYLDIAAIKETKAGRVNEHNAFYIRTADMMAAGGRWFRSSLEWTEARGVDWSKEFQEANVAFHCNHGGMRVDKNGETTVPGLYAVGETAAGPYGVDRLGGGMMTSSQVFGARAGRIAATIAGEMGHLPTLDDRLVNNALDRINNLRECNGNQKPRELIKRLQKAAWEKLMAVRSEEGLRQLTGDIEQIRNDMPLSLSVETTSDLVNALELDNLLRVGEIMSNAALMRKESRGNHYREDFPERDDANWLRTITVKKVLGEMKLDTFIRDSEWRDSTQDMDGLSWG